MNIFAILVTYGSVFVFYYLIFVAATLLVPSVYWRAQLRGSVKTTLFFYSSWWFWQLRGLNVIDGSFSQITMTSIFLFIIGIYGVVKIIIRHHEEKENDTGRTLA